MSLSNLIGKLIAFLKTYQFSGLWHNGPATLSLYVTGI
jgi:hypothetical protein